MWGQGIYTNQISSADKLSLLDHVCAIFSVYQFDVGDIHFIMKSEPSLSFCLLNTKNLNEMANKLYFYLKYPVKVKL